jgi:dihydropteroate synthase
MIYKTLGSTPEQALNGTTALHAWALERGAHLLRVHDVKEARETLLLHSELTRSQGANP